MASIRLVKVAIIDGGFSGADALPEDLPNATVVDFTASQLEIPVRWSDMERVAVFADVQNLYYTVKEQHNSHFDYGAF